jgi:DNA-binding transcriptional MerR regulator
MPGSAPENPQMNTTVASLSLQVAVPEAGAVFSIDAAAHLARMPRHILLVCCRRGLVTPQRDPNYGGLYFDKDAIRTLQRIEYLRTSCGVNLTGIEIILRLMEDVGELRALAHR